MNKTQNTVRVLLTAFSAFGFNCQTGKSPYIENVNTIHAFANEAMNLDKMLSDCKFRKTISRFSDEPGYSSKEKLITYFLLGDSVQYYKSDNKKILLYCKLSKPEVYSTYIKFFNLRKDLISSKKYHKYDIIRFADKAGFEEMEVLFIKNNIKNIIYISHPD